MEKRMLLVSTASAAETAMISEVREREEIPVLTEPRGIGAALDANMGSSVYGDDIFVDEADFPVACKAIGGMEENDPCD